MKEEFKMKFGPNDCEHENTELKYEDERFRDYWCFDCEQAIRVF